MLASHTTGVQRYLLELLVQIAGAGVGRAGSRTGRHSRPRMGAVAIAGVLQGQAAVEPEQHRAAGDP